MDVTGTSDMHELGAALLEAAAAIAHIADRDVEAHGVVITRSQAAVLRRLADSGPSSMLDLAAAIGVTGPTMTATVRILLRKGLVDRRHDDKDWRQVRVSITDSGREAVAVEISTRLQIVARALAGLSAEQRALLTVSLPSLRGLAAALAREGRDESG